MRTEELNRIYQLEALLNQAMTILVQVDDAVKAMKPVRKVHRKKIDAVKAFDALVRDKARRAGRK
jgi:hypothetical protein